MSRIDWQAYLDGSLSASEMQEAEQILRTDPQAHRRLENMKVFVAEIRRQGLTQEVPLAKLHKSIPSSRRFAWPRLLAPALAAAAVIGITYLLANREPAPIIVKNDGAMPEGRPFQSFDLASAWMKEMNGITTKPLHLASASLVGGERTSKGGCYCMKVGKDYVHLSFNASMSPGESLKPIVKDGREFLTGPKSIAFKACGVIWTCYGGTEEIRWKIAMEATDQLL